jgi:hypothetical protein
MNWRAPQTSPGAARLQNVSFAFARREWPCQMINGSIKRRMRKLEAVVLASKAPQLYIRVCSASTDGEVTRTLVVKLGSAEDAFRIASDNAA